MKIAYIAGPLRGDHRYQNIQKAREVAKKYWRLGYAVICPHTNSGNMVGLDEAQVMEGCIEILWRCDVIVMMKGWENSEGSVTELREAIESDLENIYE